MLKTPITTIFQRQNFANSKELLTCFFKTYFHTIDFLANKCDITLSEIKKEQKEETQFLLWTATYYELLRQTAIQSGNTFILKVINDVKLYEYNYEAIAELVDTLTSVLKQIDTKDYLLLSNFYYQIFEPFTDKFYMDSILTNEIYRHIQHCTPSEKVKAILGIFKMEEITPRFLCCELIYRYMVKSYQSEKGLYVYIEKLLHQLFDDITKNSITNIFDAVNQYRIQFEKTYQQQKTWEKCI